MENWLDLKWKISDNNADSYRYCSSLLAHLVNKLQCIQEIVS